MSNSSNKQDKTNPNIIKDDEEFTQKEYQEMYEAFKFDILLENKIRYNKLQNIIKPIEMLYIEEIPEDEKDIYELSVESIKLCLTNKFKLYIPELPIYREDILFKSIRNIYTNDVYKNIDYIFFDMVLEKPIPK